MFKSQIKGVVFDLDGTLVDSLKTTFEAFNHGIVTLGGKTHTPQEIMKYFGPGEGQIFARILGEEHADRAYQLCREYLDQNLHNVPFHDGVPEMLEAIKSAGLPVSIVTGRSWNTTEVILKHHRMLDRFVTVIANDHVGSPKPSPEGIALALTRMKLAAENSVYVGDSWVDTRAARLAGSHAIAALWDLMANREEIAPHDPHVWASHPREITEVVLVRG